MSQSMSQREDLLKFETGRIKALQEERLHIQKKTFTKWMNSFLIKARMEVEDLFTDLGDGKKLLKLLEIISGERLGKPNNGKMRVHKIENVNKSLAFLHTKVRLESIGAEDIVDGNNRLILGLIWTIILRFQIQDIEIDVEEDNESSEKKSAKDALLLWCQRKTKDYDYVNIQDFTVSWRSGMGFNALIHAHRPDLINYNSLDPREPIANLNYAFDVAHRELGIARLLDPEDVDTNKPDEKSIITYVASYYHTFYRMNMEMKGGRRIANIMRQMRDCDGLKQKYEKMMSDLLAWIQKKVVDLKDRTFPNSLEGIQKELVVFKQYRTIEKPPKYKERSEVEAMYFAINTRLSALKQPAYIPPDGLLVHDLEREWQLLERAEHSREVDLREELLRQERLEHLAYKFQRKGVLREGYLKEMIQVLSDPRYGSNLTQVEATVKKHEAISADILARKERFHDLTNMAEELVRENYHGSEQIKAREKEILLRWEELIQLLEKHRSNLNAFNNLMSMLREMETVTSTIREMEEGLRNVSVGNHLMGVEDLLQKQALMESQIQSMGHTIKRLDKQAKQFIATDFKEAPLLQKRLDNLNQEYANLKQISEGRRARLEEARQFFQFVQDHEEEEAWVIEKQRICQAGITAKDLRAVISLQQKHKALEDEMKARSIKCQKLLAEGQTLMRGGHKESPEIRTRSESLEEKWKALRELVQARKKQLRDACEVYQFLSDANEVDSWLKEKKSLVRSKDFGEDEPSAHSLLQRHKVLTGEIAAYQGDVKLLNQQANSLLTIGISSLSLSESVGDEEEPMEEWVNETKMVPQDVWEDEKFERIETRNVTEQKSVPQIKCLYPFSGQGISVKKDETMLLLRKTNADWWNVRKMDGKDGFVPANYVKETEPKIMTVKVPKQYTVQDVRKVMKTKMVKQTVRVKRIKPASSAKRSSDADNEFVEKRLEYINKTYQEVLHLAKERHLLLEDAIRLFTFFRECDGFETWMKEREKLLLSDSKETVDSAKRKFEKLLTDISAASRRVEEIAEMVAELERTGHSQLDRIRARQKQIQQQWDHLNRLKQQKERSLEGASSVELFNRSCGEARDWMEEKLMKMDIVELGRDLKTVQALQRKHLNLERELAPVEEKFNRVNLLANSVKKSYPHEKDNVNARQKELQGLWNKVREKAIERRSRLEEAVGQQIFVNSAKSLLAWVHDVKQALNSDESARDVGTAEQLLKKHQELYDDIKAHEDEFNELEVLGDTLLRRNPECEEVSSKQSQLREEKEAIQRGWVQKDEWLRQLRDLQLFTREADQIDAITSAHVVFLEFENLGSTLDEVEALVKRHEDFENTLTVQDEKLKAFSDNADKLIGGQHYDSKAIGERRDAVLNRRESIKRKTSLRNQLLQASMAYQELLADADDMKAWIVDKLKTASDESYKDLLNLERKLQKHEAFERELRANEPRLRGINKNGKSLIQDKHYKSPEIEETLQDLNDKWRELYEKSEDKGRKLRQAVALHGYNRTIDDAEGKLEEMSQQLSSTNTGTDLRSCKKLLKNHYVLENEMNLWEQKIADLVLLGNEMASDGHFAADKINKDVETFKKSFSSLKDPSKRRREALEEALRYHEFVFDVDAQLQWIKEHLPLASSQTLGTSLHEAQSLDKKHKKLQLELQGHQGSINKTFKLADTLIKQKHPREEQILEQKSILEHSWDDLLSLAAERARKLELNRKAQQFFFDAGEVETWMAEKNNILSSMDFGKDEDAAIKLLTKHKSLELELDTYDGLVTEMGSIAQAMIKNNHPDSKMIDTRRDLITRQLQHLQKLASARRQRLMESMYRHEYFRESEELERWIAEQMQMAASDDYGKDYEHLLILVKKFEDLKQRIDAGSARFHQCEVLAKKLIADESPYAVEFQRRQEQLGEYYDPKKDVEVRHAEVSESWQKLLSTMAAREQKLAGAGEIHRFNRDVADAVARIQEKLSSIPEELGKDLHSVQSLLRKHEGFENDLVALEAQLQVLVEDAVRLRATYPGGNATHIAGQQSVVSEAYGLLHERAVERRNQLMESLELHKYLAQVRDLVTWASGLRVTMMTEEKVRDAASAQMLKLEHEQLKAEVEAREDTFSLVVHAGKALIEKEHYAQQDVQEKMQQLLDERQKLHEDWQHKKVYLDQLIDLHFFMRDSKQLHTISASQEASLTGGDYGVTVEEVDAQVKKHEAFEKLVQAQDEKLQVLQEHGCKLIEQAHFDSQNIKIKLEEVKERRAKVKELTQKKKKTLDDALLYAQFIRDVGETEGWIDDKARRLETEGAGMESMNSLEDKIRKLQKHQAFQAELTAHQVMIDGIKAKGELLLSRRHLKSHEIRSQLDKLLRKWNSLMQESLNRGRGLEEAQDSLEFNNQVEKIEAWIRDKELMVHAGDMGRDYEHCLALQRKLDDMDSDMKVDDSRMRHINKLADKLIRQARSDTQPIQQQKDQINQKWKSLQGALGEYHERLIGALEIHAFNRDVDDTKERITEKALTMSVDDSGRDLLGVEALQRKQDALERDMIAIEEKMKAQEADSRRLVQKYPDMGSAIRAKVSECAESWRRLQQLCESRRQLLGSSYTLHRFRQDLAELELWVTDFIAKMDSSQPLPNSLHEAEDVLQLHQERKAEMDGRLSVFSSIKEFGQKLIQQNHAAKDDIEADLLRLEELRRSLGASWEERRHTLTMARQLQAFKQLNEQANEWLQSKEAFLNNEDLGESLRDVDALIRKHAGFEKTLEAHGGKVEELEKMAIDLIASKHYDSAGIQQALRDVTARRDRLKESATIRRKKLDESRCLHCFIRNIHEVESWITEKLQVTCDESYRDSTNLQSKLQKQQAFDAELSANKGRVTSVTAEGESLIGVGHFAAMEIQQRLNELESLWRQLQDASQQKKERLHDAYQALVFGRGLDELETWIDEVEAAVQSEDHGRDLSSVQHLLKRHGHLEQDFHSKSESVEALKDQSSSFQRQHHFMKDEITERAEQVIQRYHSLSEPVSIRRDNLEDALLLYQLYRDIDDELSWISDRESLASSTDLGNSLTAVQSLQKKHQALEAEIQSHEPLMTVVNSKAQQMIRSGHYASSEISQRISELIAKLNSLKDQASVRRLRLLDAVESQTFYSEASQALGWLNEKKPALASTDYGKDEDSVASLMKKLEALQRDLEQFNHTMGKLANLARGLMDRGHFDSQNIKNKQSVVEASYKELQKLAEIRESRLADSKKLFEFLRDVDEVTEWINDQIAVAASEDYGRDVEHVEILIHKFERFLTGLGASEERVRSIMEHADALLQDGHPDPNILKGKADDVSQLWEELKEVASARQEALAGAKQVHQFDRRADETISWIAEKDTVLSSEDYGQDLNSIQQLVRKHQGLERDLAAVKEQVEAVVEEAGRLAQLFPDARDHISVKHDETVFSWNQLLEKAAQRKDKLTQAEQLQAYFDDYRELLAWLSEMIAKVTSPELARDVSSAETLILRHHEYKAEMEARGDAFSKFYQRGRQLIQEGHFLAEEIQEKISVLENRRAFLLSTWERREELYKQNLDTQMWLRDAEQLETWLGSREPMLHDDNLGSSIQQVEDLIRKHDDFLQTVDAQEDNFNTLKRITMLEEAYTKLQQEEEEARKAEHARMAAARVEEIKRKEVQRITDERRRTQEIKLPNKEEMIAVNGSIERLHDHPSSPYSIRPLSTPAHAFRESEELSSDEDDDSDLGSPKDGSDEMTQEEMKKARSHGSLFRGKDLISVKRAESLRGSPSGGGKTKRAPSFTTRRRTQSFRKHKQQQAVELQNLPPVEVEGQLERKQELQSGGKRATMRSWKSYYTVLCGQLMCFFKDQDDFCDAKAAAPPINLYQAKCQKAIDYTKKKHVFRLNVTDGSEFLFMADDETKLDEWVKKLTFHAALPPRMQLMPYDSHKGGEEMPQKDGSSSSSSSSSRSSSPERKPQQPLYANMDVVQETAATQETKPPVPPRSSRDSTDMGRAVEYNGKPHAHRKSSGDSVGSEEPPPLPITAPPRVPSRVHHQTQDWRNVPSHGHSSTDLASDDVMPPDYASKYHSLPPQQQSPKGGRSRVHPTEESQPLRKDKKIFGSFFGRKKKTNL